MAKKRAISRVALKKVGAENFAPLLFSPDAKSLGYSKSYLNKLRRDIKDGKDIPLKVKQNVRENFPKKQYSGFLPLKYGKKVSVNIPKSIINKHYGKRRFIWVKIKVNNNGQSIWTSYQLPADKGKKLNKFINGVLNNQLNRYEGVNTVVEQISIENI